ncbi:MAG: hypothetical protein ACLP0J_14465 [Solirubrobacteraceae bacterium]
MAEQAEWDRPLDRFANAVACLADAGDLFGVLDADLDRPALVVNSMISVAVAVMFIVTSAMS